jgi:hypothetical protein
VERLTPTQLELQRQKERKAAEAMCEESALKRRRLEVEIGTAEIALEERKIAAEIARLDLEERKYSFEQRKKADAT